MRRVTLIAIAALCFLAGIPPGHAGPYPDQPIRFVVASAPGTSPDQIARLIKPGIEARLKQTIIVENKVGANGLIAVNQVSQSGADGYTILAATAGTYTANPWLYQKSGGGKIAEFEPISLVASTALNLVVRSNLGVSSCPDFLQLARGRPGQLNLASSTQGSFTHLAAEMVRDKAKLDFQIIPFMGAVAAENAVVGGHADFMIEAMGTLQGQVDAGNLLTLATTGGARDPFLPKVMTLQECGVPDMSLTGWVGLAAPKGTDPAIINALYDAVAAASKEQDYVKRLTGLKWNSVAMAPSEFRGLIAKEREDMRRIIESANIKIQ